MVKNAIVIKENSQHYFHIAPNLACLLWPRRPQSLPLWWLGLFFWVIPMYPKVITGNYCLHVKFVSWSAHCSRSMATARLVSFCSTVSSFGTDFAEMHLIPKSSVRMDRTKPNESSNSSESSLFFYSLLFSMAECTFINHQFVTACRGPPWKLITLLTDIHAFLNRLDHSLTSIWSIASFPKAFWIIT